MNLAERCYDAEKARDELYNYLEKIIGVNCVEDSYIDTYDGSIEIVLSDYALRNKIQLNGTIADKILEETGFSKIYESIGNRGSLWVHTKFRNFQEIREDGSYLCSAREGREDNPHKLKRLEKLLSLIYLQCGEPAREILKNENYKL